MLVASSKVLPRRSLPQPQPYICQGGDCGACSLGGVLGIPVPEVYERFDSKGLTHDGEMDRCLRCSLSDGLSDRAWDFWAEVHGWHKLAFGRPAFLASLQWFRVVQMAIDAGYYGLAEVDYSRKGGLNGCETNHWIVLCGYRTEGAVVNKIITGEILMSCSARGDEWIEARQFLQTMGGYATRFCRPISDGSHA